MLTVPIVGTSPLNWQIFALLARWLAGVVAWRLLRKVMPGQDRYAFWIAVLFTVYPGFRQQYLAVIYSHYLLQMAFQLFMIGLTLGAVRASSLNRILRTTLYILSLFGSVIGLFTSEYFFGLELMRPLALWCILGGDGISWRQRLRKTALLWLPFLGVVLGFLFWRIVIFKFPTYQPVYMQSARPDLIAIGLNLAHTIAADAVELGLYAWVLPLRIVKGLANGQPAAWAALAMAAGGVLFLLVCARFLKHPDPTGNSRDRRLAIGLVLAGGAGILSAGWPFWFVNLPVDTRLDVGSRFAISFIPGASLSWMRSTTVR
jgi:hypothetical protein